MPRSGDVQTFGKRAKTRENDPLRESAAQLLLRTTALKNVIGCLRPT